MARSINYKGKSVDYSKVAEMSVNYDKENPNKDTVYVIINCAVLGNALGKESIDGDDQSTALAAIVGRKYNNGRAAFPITLDYVKEHYAEIDSICQAIAGKTSSISAEIQKTLTPDQIKQGREVAMRTQAIRDARDTLITNGSAIDEREFAKANQEVRATVASKVYCVFSGTVSGRRLEDNDSSKRKPNYKTKNIQINGTNVFASVATADMSGLKRVPLFTSEARDKAEQKVFDIATIIATEVGKIPEKITDESVVTALKNIVKSLPGDANYSYEVGAYTEEEKKQIEIWADMIVANYNRT